MPDDTNLCSDVFVHDLETGVTERVSVASDGTEADLTSLSGTISDDGRFVAFHSVARNLGEGEFNADSDVFVHDRTTRETFRVSVSGVPQIDEPNGDSFDPQISGDGRFVAFSSSSTDLVPFDANGLLLDTFVRDLDLGVTTVVSLSSTAEAANGLGAGAFGPAISADGSVVVFAAEATNLVPDDTNGWRDIFVHGRTGR